MLEANMMKIGAFILILSSPFAWAGFGNIVPDSSVPHRPCGQTTFERNADFIYKTALMPMTDDNGNIIKDKDGLYKDSRANLYELGPKMSGNLALNAAELEVFNNSTPTLECTSHKSASGGRPSRIEMGRSSGFLYGNCQQYATAAHSLRDSEGRYFKSCVLKASKDSDLKDGTPLDMSKIETMNDPTGDPDGAIAVIKLGAKLTKPNGNPYECLGLNATGKTVGFKEKLGVVSSLQYLGDRSKSGVRDENKIMGGPGQNPIIQECPRPYDRRIVTTPIFFGQCSTTKMASGSVGYFRDESGKPSASVIFVSGGMPHRDGTGFVLDLDPEKANYAHGVILDSEKVRKMMEFQNRK